MNGNGDGFKPTTWAFGLLGTLLVAAVIGWVSRTEARGATVEAHERELALLKYRMEKLETTAMDTHQNVVAIRAVVETAAAERRAAKVR